MLTRRSAVGFPLAWAAAASATRFGLCPARADTPFVRFNVASTDGKAMLRTYAQGVKALKANSGRLPRSWTFQWYIHHTRMANKATEIRHVFGAETGANRALAQAAWSTCQAHVANSHEVYFLPWHRLYVRYFEEIIRAVTSTPGFTLPYWDYTSPGQGALPDEFLDAFAKDSLFGVLHVPNRNTDDGSGQYANVNAGEPINIHARGRENFLNLDDMKAPAYEGTSGFNALLDGNLHGNIHDRIGDPTNMGDFPTAAGDPIFWLHHCNIDRIWYAWNKAGGRNPTAASWRNASFVFADGAGRRVSAAVRTIADIGALPYTYDALPGPAKPPPLIAARSTPLAVSAASPAMVVPPAGASVAAIRRAALPVLGAAAPPGPPSAPPPPTVVAQTTAQTTAPIPLGDAPKKVTLQPAIPALTELQGAAPSPGGRRAATHARRAPPMVGAAPTPEPVSPPTGPNQRIMLILHDVQAQAHPGTAYKVYINLPADASPEVAEQHYAGLLNFFGKVTMPGMAAMGGKTAAFDITEVVSALGLTGALESEIAVTLVPGGKPNPAAQPVIGKGIEIRRE